MLALKPFKVDPKFLTCIHLNLLVVFYFYRIRETCKRHIIGFKLFDQKDVGRYKNKPHFVIQQWLSKLAYCVFGGRDIHYRKCFGHFR